jgi:hypothetical protein
MWLRRSVWVFSTALAMVIPLAARGTNNVPGDFRPDPKSVQRYGLAYRYPQAGWIVLHIEGAPYERGYQHGRLLAPEIAAFVRCSAALASAKAPAEGWKNIRSLVNALFVRRYEQEYLEEMKGIADGATAAGARFDNRPIDLVDVVALNVWPEIDTLDSALEATPTGLEGIRFPHSQPRAMPPPKEMHCSAFAATGPATADGKIVFGHITMFSLFPSLFYNVWLDVKPAKGHRVFMQSYPAGIQSGLDYYMNDAGLLVCETTLAQTRFDIRGMSVASRIRQVLQYADGIDKAVAILEKANNGLYTNEWLLADIKTNEIAMFELGTFKTKLYRSSRHEWFGGTEGFYWGCNNTKDLQVRLETIPGVNGRPANVVWHPSDRDKTWVHLFHKHKGKIDAGFGKEAFTTPPLAAYHSLDAKYTTTAMAKDLKTWALYGPPLGRTWRPTREEWQRYPEIRPMVSNPWTVLTADAPSPTTLAGPPVVDLPKQVESPEEAAAKLEEDKPLPIVPAWHGTLLPKTDADIWLATAFADYEKIVAEENALRARAANGELTAQDRDRLALPFFAYRSSYLTAARAAADSPLVAIRGDVNQDGWYRVAAGKGVLVLHELRRVLGDQTFEEAMEAFGKQHAGQEVTTAEFQAHMTKTGGKPLNGFFDYWLRQLGLPSWHLDAAEAKAKPRGKKGFTVDGAVSRSPSLAQGSVEITVETSKGEVAKTVTAGASPSKFQIDTVDQPRRVIVDKYGWTAKANGGVFSISTFQAELSRTLIVYGTLDEVATNREAARTMQRAIVETWSNFTVPFKADTEVRDSELKTHHLLLVGRPDSNRCVERFQSVLPIQFGSRSFTVRQESYAHPWSAVIAAGENPLNRRYSIVVVAGLGGESTLRAAPLLMRRGQHAGEVLVLANGAKPRALVIPAKELVRELAEINGGQKVTKKVKGKK